jgi:hypothetical protein
MLKLKEFLTEECRNVSQLLNDTLRHAYSVADGKYFYIECQRRVIALMRQIDAAGDSDMATLGLLSERISDLSELITRIERSHIGEFSWPFAECLRRLAIDICRRQGLPSPDYDPLFFISAEGGLLSYSISFEPAGNTALDAKKQIFNIVFPRSLKYSVLLHPILGHEIGHAAYSVPDVSHRLDNEVLDRLLETGPMRDTESLKQWLLDFHQIDVSDDTAAEIYANWQEEYLCDLFGLVLMGPSFVSAHRSLLRTIDPPGQELSGTHPPKLARYWMIDVAMEHLGWNNFGNTSTGVFGDAIRSLNHSCADAVLGITPVYKVFAEQNIRNAVDGLSAILTQIGQAAYKLPPEPGIEVIVNRICEGIPPAHVRLTRKENTDHQLELPETDFRSILFAGWLAWHQCKRNSAALTYSQINRLCDMGLLHLQAISTWMANNRHGST